MTPITLHAITKRFGSTVAVDNVDLQIEPGKLFFLLGPSGCGKTTLLRMLAGLVEPTAGTIHFGEQDVTRVPTGQRNTAMVFQGYALWPHMTVAQNVAFGLDVRQVPTAERRQRVDTALEQVRMSEYAHRKPAELSGGQQQRVALARALVVNPAVLLLDEPLSNLDAKLRLEMRTEIRRLCDETSVTAVYVTHDQEEALSIADNIAVMDRGKVCQVGPPREVYYRPVSTFVADFLGKANFIPGRISAREGESLIVATPAGSLRSNVYANDLTVGTKVTCSVRPEAVRPLAAEDEADNVIAAQHRQTIYLGHLAQHLLEGPDGVRIQCAELKPSEGPEPGSSYRLGFAAADVVVLGE
jgi:iron(III) transport system ATP-binding protein